MNIYARKESENKSQAAANSLPKQQNSGKPIFQFVDKRPKAIAQKKLHEMAYNSNQVKQLNNFKNIASNSTKAKETPQLQVGVTKIENKSTSHASNPSQNTQRDVLQLMPWYARMALGASAGVVLGATGLLAAGPALALGIAGAGLGAMMGNEAEEEPVRHGTAEERLERMRNRGNKRKQVGRIPTGRYNTPTGPTTVSGLFHQRMTQSRREDYGNETFGSIPPYQGLQNNIPNHALPVLSDRHSNIPPLTNRQNLATALVHTLVHVSEEDRVPGTSSYFRAMNRDYIRTGGQGQHPLNTANFPARSTAEEQRDLIEGRTLLTAQQRRALENDSEGSSDEDNVHYIQR